MDFDIPKDLTDYLVELDDFIEREIRPLEQQDDNIRFFDHRREDARTDWERGGLPNEEWEMLLAEARRRADAAGHYRYPFPAEYGGKDGSNLGMAIIREHLAHKGLGLHCDLQNEHAIVGNNVGLLLMINYGTEAQKAEWIDDLAEGRRGFAFGITEPAHGSDATWMETTAVRDGDEWVINGEKTWNTGMHKAQYDMIMARTSGQPGDGKGITAFLTPHRRPGVQDRGVPLDVQHADRPRPRLASTTSGSPHSADLRRGRTGPPGGAALLQREPHPPSGLQLGAAQFCIDESVEFAKTAQAVWETAVDQPGHPVPVGRATDTVRDAAGLDPQDGLDDGHLRRLFRVGQGVDVQLHGQPPVLRRGRPGHAGARGARVLPAQAVRAHLPPPPPLPDHRGGGRDPDAPGGRLHVRVHGPAGAEGRGRALMLTPHDDYPVHQTALPLAHAGDGHPDFYDRFWFNGYTEDFYFAVAMGLYPNRGVIDAAFSVVHDGVQRSVFASGRIPFDRTETTIGPVSIEIVEPLRVNRVRIDAPHQLLTADLTWTSRTEAYEEPRQTRYAGTRLAMDVTRATSLGTWTGTIESGGHRLHLGGVDLRHQGPVVGHPAGRLAGAGRAGTHHPPDLFPVGSDQL